MKRHVLYRVAWVAVLVLLMCAGFAQGEASARTPMSMGGSNPGGTAFIVGTAVANIINAHVPHVILSHEVTAGGRDNAVFTQTGELDLGYGFGGWLYEAYHGVGDFEGNPHYNLRGFMPWWEYPVQIVVLADSGIYSISDLRGRRVGLNVHGSGAHKTAVEVFSTLGMEAGRDFQSFYLAFQDAVDSMRLGRIDAQIFATAAPTPILMEMGITHNFRVIPFTDEEMRLVSERFPHYRPGVMRGGTYANIPYDVPTLMAYTIVWISANVPEQTAYDMIKALWNNKADLEMAHGILANLGPELVREGLIGVAPLHPGVERFYREIGVID